MADFVGWRLRLDGMTATTSSASKSSASGSADGPPDVLWCATARPIWQEAQRRPSMVFSHDPSGPCHGPRKLPREEGESESLPDLPLRGVAVRPCKVRTEPRIHLEGA